jgi:hypothetical protein
MKTRIITVSAAAALTILALAGCTGVSSVPAAAPAAPHTVIQQTTPATILPTPTVTITETLPVTITGTPPPVTITGTPPVMITERETQAPSRPRASPGVKVKRVIDRLGTSTKHLVTSPTFYAAIGALVALLLGVVQMWRWRRPRRLIYAQKTPRRSALQWWWSFLSRVCAQKKPRWSALQWGWSFLSRAVKAHAVGSTTLSFYDLARSEPDARIIEIILAGDGRQDIPSDSFDLQEPVTVDAGQPIFAVLSNSRPKWIRAPSARIDGQYLRIGPGLIARRQYLSYRLLISHVKSDVTLQAALTDVTISTNNGYGLGQRRLRATLSYYPLSLILALIVVGYSLAVTSWPPSFTDLWQSGLGAVYLAIIPAIIMGWARMRGEGLTAALLVPDGGNMMSDEGPPAATHGTLGTSTSTATRSKVSADAEAAASGAEERAEGGRTVVVMPADVWRSGLRSAEEQGDDHADSYHEA